MTEDLIGGEKGVNKNVVIVILMTFVVALNIMLGVLLYPTLIGREWDKGYNM